MADKELSKGKQLEKELCWEYPNIAKKAPEQREKAYEFAKGYMEFLGSCKTERECVKFAEKMFLEAGYERFDSKKKYKAGDKVFSTNRGKAMAITVFGTRSLADGVRINGAHIDSPRIDLRPNPLYESNDIALFKTHYYGGIKKYQWGSMPLAMHGVVVKKDGTTVEITIGEDPSDPVLYITDLLIHLSKQQMQRPLSEGLRGEELNVVLGTTPYPDDDVKEPFRLEVLRYLNEKYGITERDFARAEIEFVPAAKPRDIGLDRSLVGGYGQDDRVCAYAALMAQLATKNPEYTTVTILTDKEEIGSNGNTGSESNFLYDYIGYLAQAEGVDLKDVLAHSACLSADVNGAYDPTFADAFEAKNSSYLNRGVVLTKYTGSGGKFGASDASAEFMAKVIDIMDANGVYWQIGELGKLDLGGGGTIAGDVARLNVDVVDLGVAVLSMHSPFEVTSKLDIYNMYLAFKAFYPEV
jgi:M18 family aminopeptidase